MADPPPFPDFAPSFPEFAAAGETDGETGTTDSVARRPRAREIRIRKASPGLQRARRNVRTDLN